MLDQQTSLRQEDWRQHFEAWRSSGQSQRAYCESAGLKYSRFCYWRRKLEGEPGQGGAGAASRFVPVALGGTGGTAGLRVVLPNGAELQGIDADNLALVGQLLARLS
ncbi:MAG: IS66 family insertion sequence element accessory protein TnpB [Gammaproteobacteria bacterium]|nr:IS66 family insertion sequence element accessory protein TnpB [Gammaproteobacteria bacterium]MDZ7753347.1 IS66 family insertion sequence element accessory protein TnpB [Gammaproteobacteria bacterium]